MMLVHDLFFRAGLGCVLAGSIAWVALRFRWLTLSGAFAALALGTAAMAAGWSWGFLLTGFFLASGILTKFGEAAKKSALSAIAAKGGARDAWQVGANGALYGIAALASVFSDDLRFRAVAIGALAAAAADTWATEIGTLAAARPRL